MALKDITFGFRLDDKPFKEGMDRVGKAIFTTKKGFESLSDTKLTKLTEQLKKSEAEVKKLSQAYKTAAKEDKASIRERIKQLQTEQAVLREAEEEQRNYAASVRRTKAELAKMAAQAHKSLKVLSTPLKGVGMVGRGLGRTAGALGAGVLAGAAGGGLTGLAGGVGAGVGGAAGALFGPGGALLGAGVGAAIGAGTAGLVGKIGSALTSGNADIEQAMATFEAFTKSAAKAKDIVFELKKEADKTPFDTKEMIQAGKTLMFLANGSKKQLMEMVKSAEILAAINPEQGLVGGAKAVSEAVSGDFVSLQDRFGISKNMVKELKDQGLEGLAIVNEALKRMGAGPELVEKMANTFAGRLSTVSAFIDDLKMKLGEGIFGVLSTKLGEVSAWIEQNGDRLRQLATNIGTWLGEKFSSFVTNSDKWFSKLYSNFVYVQTLLTGLGSRFSEERVVQWFAKVVRFALASLANAITLLFRWAVQAAQHVMPIFKALGVQLLGEIVIDTSPKLAQWLGIDKVAKTASAVVKDHLGKMSMPTAEAFNDFVGTQVELAKQVFGDTGSFLGFDQASTAAAAASSKKLTDLLPQASNVYQTPAGMWADEANKQTEKTKKLTAEQEKAIKAQQKLNERIAKLADAYNRAQGANSMFELKAVAAANNMAVTARGLAGASASASSSTTPAAANGDSYAKTYWGAVHQLNREIADSNQAVAEAQKYEHYTDADGHTRKRLRSQPTMWGTPTKNKWGEWEHPMATTEEDRMQQARAQVNVRLSLTAPDRYKMVENT